MKIYVKEVPRQNISTTVVQSDSPVVRSDSSVVQSDSSVVQSDSSVVQSDSPVDKWKYITRIEVAVLCMLITIVWTLFSLPIIFYYLPNTKVRI